MLLRLLLCGALGQRLGRAPDEVAMPVMSLARCRECGETYRVIHALEYSRCGLNTAEMRQIRRKYPH